VSYRPSKFRLGSLRDRITIQQLTETISDAGDVTPTWSDKYKDEPAAFDPVAGQETTRGKQVDAGTKGIFTIHYRTGITPEMRIQYNSETYGIVFVRPVDGGRRYLELHCKS
jgi:SPP1 family predicted phage head-tail adaptor